MSLDRLSLADVVAVRVTDVPTSPAGRADGYGTHALPYRLQLTDGRWRRVYVDVLGNGGAIYVNRAGREHYLSGEVEALLEGARDLDLDDARRIAAEWQSPGAIGAELATLATTGEATAELPDDIRATLAGLGEGDLDRWPLIRLLGWSVAR